MQQIGRQEQHLSLISSQNHLQCAAVKQLACCGIIFGCATEVSLPSNSLSNNLYGWHSREIGLKLLGNERSLPGFGKAITRDFHQILGIRLIFTHRLNNSSNHFLACWPNYFSSSVKMPSKSIALPSLKAAMPLENS